MKYLLALVFTYSIGFSQNLNIKVQIKGGENDTITLGYFSGNNTFAIDKQKADNKGITVFKKDQKQHSGQYFIYIKNKFMKEILLGSNQQFEVYSDTANPNTKTKIFGDKNNEVYNEYQKFSYNKSLALMKAKEKEEDMEPLIVKARREIEQNERDIIQNYKGLLVSDFFKIQRKRNIPNLPDSNKVYESYVQHYWDNYNLSDSTITRTKIFKKDLDVLFDKVLYQKPAYLTGQIDILLKSSSKNSDVFRYLAFYFYNKYVDTDIMGLDSVFVYVAENYFLNGKIPSLEADFLTKLKREVEITKPNFIGKTAPNLDKLKTYDDTYINLQDIVADYIVLYFWETNCSHCKKSTPKLKTICSNIASMYNVKFVAFYTQANEAEWKKDIQEHQYFDFLNCYDPLYQTGFREKYGVTTTPKIYILDKNKKIIAKRIGVEQITEVIQMHKKGKL